MVHTNEIMPDLISPKDADYIFQEMKKRLAEISISTAAQYWTVMSANFPEEYDLESGY